MVDRIKRYRNKRKKINEKLLKATDGLYYNAPKLTKPENTGYSLTDMEYTIQLLRQDIENKSFEKETMNHFVGTLFTNDLSYTHLSYDDVQKIIKSYFTFPAEEDKVVKQLAFYETALQEHILDELPDFWFEYQDINREIYQEWLERHKQIMEGKKERFNTDFIVKKNGLPEFNTMPKKLKEVANALTLDELRMLKNKVELSKNGNISPWYVGEINRKINYIFKTLLFEMKDGNFFSKIDKTSTSLLLNVLMQLRIYAKNGVKYVDEIFDLLNVLGNELAYIQKYFHKTK